MGFVNNPPFNKKPHDVIKSADWNNIGSKLDVLDNKKVNKAGDSMTGALTIDYEEGTALDVKGVLRTSDFQLSKNSWAYLDIRSSSPNTDAAIRLYNETNYWSIHNHDTAGNNLDIRYMNISKLTVTPAGSVGIGTSSPGATLDVAGAARCTALEVAGDGKFNGGDLSIWSGKKAVNIRQDGNNTFVSNKKDFVGNGADPNGLLILNGSSGVQINYGDSGTSGTQGFLLNSSGNIYIPGSVGIGILTPGATLDVAGAARCTALDVAGNGKFSGGDLSIWSGKKAVNIRQDGTRTYISNKKDFGGNGADPNGELILNGSSGVLINYGDTGGSGTTGLILNSSGNVGIKTVSPIVPLHVNGNSQLDGNLLINGITQIGRTDAVKTLCIWGPSVTDTSDGALAIKQRVVYPQVPLPFILDESLRIDYRSINTSNYVSLLINNLSKRAVIVGSTRDGANGMAVYGPLRVYGNITADNVGCYITNRFINRFNDKLEQGDVVVLGKGSASIFYGADDNIPVPEVDLTDKAYDNKVCGIVEEILVEEEPQSLEEGTPVTSEAEKPQTKKSKSKRSIKAPKISKDGVKRLQIFTQEEIEKIDLKRIDKDQIGRMVTGGCFTHCKVDADIAPIEPGDLLTTSPTKGHAQKVMDPTRAVGAILGKALGAINKGKGKIPVLLMLQ